MSWCLENQDMSTGSWVVGSGKKSCGFFLPSFTGIPKDDKIVYNNFKNPRKSLGLAGGNLTYLPPTLTSSNSYKKRNKSCYQKTVRIN